MAFGHGFDADNRRAVAVAIGEADGAHGLVFYSKSS